MDHEKLHTEGSEHEEETHHKRKSKQNPKSIIAIAIAVLVIILVAGFVWLYTGQLSQAKEKIFKAVPLPAAIVDMKFLPAKYVINRIELSKQLLDMQGQGAQANSSQVYQQVIDAKKLDAIASKKNIGASSAEIDEEYGNIIKQYAGGDENAFKAELTSTYHMSPEEFKKEVVRQEILQGNLALWYNQQKDLNKEALDKANDLLGKINGGQSFDDVAKVYTQDEATKDFAGDSGVVSYNDLLPEFRDALKDAKVGDTKLVVSRYGVHILKVLELNSDGENGSKQIHLQQIFVKPTGFDQWLSKQTDNVKVIKLLKFS